MHNEEIREIIEYYSRQGAPQDQQMLIALLRELQEMHEGVIPKEMLLIIAQNYGIRDSMLMALIRRIPGLRCEDVPHRLEVCGTCKAGAKLRNYIEKTYDVRSGSCNEKAGFAYHVVSCMKNCKNGPSIRWDGKLFGHADETIIQELVGK